MRVRFLQDVPWTNLLQLFDEVNEHAFIASGTVMQMPLWMARALTETGVLTILPARQYGVRVRADLAADATAVNLKDLSPCWYELGIKMSAMLPTEGIARTLRGAFAGRLPFIGRGVFMPSESPSDPHKTVFGVQSSSSILERTERRIYAATIAAKKDVDGWYSRENNLLKPFDIYNELSY